MTQESNETRVEKLLRGLKNHPGIAVVLVVCIAIIGLGNLTDALDSTISFFGKHLNPQPRNGVSTESEKALAITSTSQAGREPIWGDPSFDEDEVTAIIKGRGKLAAQEDSREIAGISFWKLASAGDTNWRVAVRRTGSNYALALLDPETTSAKEEWEFVIGGIECPKNYRGLVGVVLIAAPKSYIASMEEQWKQAANFGGLDELPSGAGIQKSVMKTFATAPVRD